MASPTIEDEKKSKPKIPFTIDGQRYTTTKKELAAGELLSKFAKLDPALYYLVEIKGRHQTPFKDPELMVRVHKGATFISVSTGPTPVS